jgi:hypothetical protein
VLPLGTKPAGPKPGLLDALNASESVDGRKQCPRGVSHALHAKRGAGPCRPAVILLTLHFPHPQQAALTPADYEETPVTNRK